MEIVFGIVVVLALIFLDSWHEKRIERRLGRFFERKLSTEKRRPEKKPHEPEE